VLLCIASSSSGPPNLLTVDLLGRRSQQEVLWSLPLVGLAWLILLLPLKSHPLTMLFQALLSKGLCG
jgi:hypothetical protein